MNEELGKAPNPEGDEEAFYRGQVGPCPRCEAEGRPWEAPYIVHDCRGGFWAACLHHRVKWIFQFGGCYPDNLSEEESAVLAYEVAEHPPPSYPDAPIY